MIYLVLILILLVFPEPVFAYIDPGSGSMILQLLLAGVAGLGMAVKLYWRRITGIFRRTKATPNEPSNENIIN